MYITKFNLEKLRQAVPIFIKIMKWDTTKRYNVFKKNVSVKIISVLFEIIIKRQFFYDYLDETMITQEIKLRNP